MKSIRAKIMWLLFSSVLIASLIIGSTGIFLTSNVIKESTTENMRLLCRNNADKIDITFAKIEESVNTLVHYVESELLDIQMLKDETYRKAFSAEVQKNALHHIESVEGAAAVYLHYDPNLIEKNDGFFFAKYDGSDEFKYHPLTDISAVEDENELGWWYVPTISGKATWFEAYNEPNLKQYVISYVVPIFKDDQLIGVIGADISAEHIISLVKQVSIFNSGQGALLKSDGTVLYHPNFERGVLIGEGDPGFDGVIEKLTKEDTKELISYELKGVNKKLASCKLRNGMLMVCFAPEKEIYHQQTMLMIYNIIITAVVVVCAIFIAFLLSKALTSPIKKLNEAAKHLTDGEFDFEIKKSSSDEIGELTNTFIETRKILMQQINLLDTEAHRDGLTGVANKSALIDTEKELNQQISKGIADFTIIAFDVNKLKIANDVFGHNAGDKLLITAANHLSEIFGVANVYRIGGDEFVVILMNEDNIDSEQKINACVEGMKNLTVEDYPQCNVSCAYGVSHFDKETDLLFSNVLERADKEMYKNKTISKKEQLSWQEGFKGIKQLQIEKYYQLLQSLKDSTDDFLFLMNIETGTIRFFGGENKVFNITEDTKLSNGFSEMLNLVIPNDRQLIKNAIESIMNRDTEIMDINFRVFNNNSIYWANCRGNVIKDETDSHFVLIGRISQNAVKHLYNPVTTLFNKTKLKIDLAKGIENPFNYLMLIDIDGLSEINLKRGSIQGDNLLKALSKELEAKFSMWQIYHAEKDRFVVLLNSTSKEEVDDVFSDIKNSLSGECSISASIVPNDKSLYISAENIYDYAVQILNNAKRNGIGQLVFFSKENILERVSAIELFGELEESVKQNCEGFHLVYQPQISADDYSIISAEALLRFTSKKKGQVFPDQFIPVLEQTGLINNVGLWVINEALSKCKEWRKFKPDFKISVNVSPEQLKNNSIVMQIENLLAKHSLPGEALIIEITETAQLDENEAMFAILTKFRSLGIQIAIDDFGTGYSNLRNLKYIHANILKVDRIFIRDIKKDGYNYTLIYNIIEFAKANSLRVCLEGIETTEELQVLSSLQSDIYQGYLFDKPCPADVIEAKYFFDNTDEYKAQVERTNHFLTEKNKILAVNIETKTILNELNIGLWVVRLNSITGENELYSDESMKKLLGLKNDITPQEYFKYFYDNIKPSQLENVSETFNEMANSEKVIQSEYSWQHPESGEIIIRIVGRCTENSNDTIVFEGFLRNLNETENNS